MLSIANYEIHAWGSFKNVLGLDDFISVQTRFRKGSCILRWRRLTGVAKNLKRFSGFCIHSCQQRFLFVNMHVYLRTAYTFISYSALYKEKAKKNLWNFTESLEGQHSIRYAVYLQYTAKYAGDVLQKDASCKSFQRRVCCSIPFWIFICIICKFGRPAGYCFAKMLIFNFCVGLCTFFFRAGTFSLILRCFRWHTTRMQKIARNWRHFLCRTFRRPQSCYVINLNSNCLSTYFFFSILFCFCVLIQDLLITYS